MLEWLKDYFTEAGLQRIFAAVILLAVGVLAIRILLALLKRALEKSEMEKAAYTLIQSFVRVVLYLLLALTAASALGIDVTGVVALASVLTLALSLALQNMVANIIGGFTILYTKPFHSGDYVEIAGQGGTVTEINMTYTVLASPDNKRIALPNSTVVAEKIVNYSASDTRRVEVKVTAPYGVPHQKVLDALVLAGTQDNVLLEPAPQAVVLELGDSGIAYSLRVWVKTADYWDVYFAVVQRVKAIFDEQDIPVACPRMDVRVEK